MFVAVGITPSPRRFARLIPEARVTDCSILCPVMPGPCEARTGEAGSLASITADVSRASETFDFRDDGPQTTAPLPSP